MTTNQPAPELDSLSVRVWRQTLAGAANRLDPLMALYKPYVDGLANLPADGRFLLVGNHTQFGLSEIFLIPYYVRAAIGVQVRTLADRQLARASGPQAAFFTAYGAVLGSPENASRLMLDDQTILVFPGGGREMPKFKGEEYTLRWNNRYGFARSAIEHGYPIVTAGLVGGDDVLTSITTRDSLWGRFSQRVSERLSGRPDMAFPPLRGIGPTLIPRPRRMYLRFGPAIATPRPEQISPSDWVTTVKERVEVQLGTALTDLQRIRDGDPYRELNPLAWQSAIMPSELDSPSPF